MEDNTLEDKTKETLEVENKEVTSEEKTTVESTEQVEDTGLVDAGDYLSTQTTTEDVSEKVEDKVENELSQEQVLSYLNKNSGKEYNDINEYFKEKTVEVEKPLEFADEQLKMANDYIKETGRSFSDWQKTQSVDFDSLTSEQLIVGDLIAKNGLTHEEATILFNDKYKVDENEYSEEEIRVAKVKMKVDAQSIKTEAKEIQEKFRKPVEKKTVDELQTQQKNQSEEDNSKLEREQLEQANKAKKDRFIESMSSSVNSIEKLEIGGVGFNLNDEAKTQVIEGASNLENFWSENFIKDGKWDMNKLTKVMILAKGDNLDAVVGNIRSSLKGQGKEEIIQNRANIDLIPSSGSSDELDPKIKAQLERFKEGLQGAV